MARRDPRWRQSESGYGCNADESMDPPPRSFAVEANNCFMVRIFEIQPNTSLWRAVCAQWQVPLGSSVEFTPNRISNRCCGNAMSNLALPTMAPCSRPSTPRSAPPSAVTFRPALTATVRGALTKLGRGGETPLNRTEKHSGSHGHHSAGPYITSRRTRKVEGQKGRTNMPCS